MDRLNDLMITDPSAFEQPAADDGDNGMFNDAD